MAIVKVPMKSIMDKKNTSGTYGWTLQPSPINVPPKSVQLDLVTKFQLTEVELGCAVTTELLGSRQVQLVGSSFEWLVLTG